ncbi:hypothetical protein GWK47_039233 [Chionoecetes opilio]|uniref:Uncharacterized protein n=1 Tax=Chionoecetes opilio TaxID=41210 RepID=A0A8J5D1F7_CHIOP|nr:hypothetical protein GWK47_039233 [Chionoecetes opilio]
MTKMTSQKKSTAPPPYKVKSSHLSRSAVGPARAEVQTVPSYHNTTQAVMFVMSFFGRCTQRRPWWSLSLTAIDELVYDIVGRKILQFFVGVKEPYAFGSCLGQLRKPKALCTIDCKAVAQAGIPASCSLTVDAQHVAHFSGTHLLLLQHHLTLHPHLLLLHQIPLLHHLRLLHHLTLLHHLLSRRYTLLPCTR